MATSANKGGKKFGFLDWLTEQINSGKYMGLAWIDESHTTFRIPWKHNSKKNLVEDDYEIFKAWAVFSKKYNTEVLDPSKWKINFRCAMNSTKRFKEVASNEADFHKYRIIHPNSKPELSVNPPPDTNNGSDYEADASHIKPYGEEYPVQDMPAHLPQQEIDVAFQTLSLENVTPGAAVPNENAVGNFYQASGDTLNWIIQQSQMNLNEMQQVSWAPAVAIDPNNPTDIPGGAVPYDQRSACVIPQASQTGCLPVGNGVVVEPMTNNCYQEVPQWLAANTPNGIYQSAAAFPVQHAVQNIPATNQLNQVGGALCNNGYFVDNVYLNETSENGGMNNGARNGYPLPENQQAMMEERTFPPSVVLPTGQPALNSVPLQVITESDPYSIEVSIYYRGKLQYEAQVNSCMFTYNQNCPKPHNIERMQFPNLEKLTDRKQVQHTLKLLETAGLLLYQKNKKIWAKRVGACKVFCAFSKELDDTSQDPPYKLLQRDEETEIFSYEQFYQELVEIQHGHRVSSPDYTIYLCFGQRFSASKPKDSKLILVKLVPNLCKCWHELLQREGFSSLNSENASLQISNSLYDMIEQLSTIFMQTEAAF